MGRGLAIVPLTCSRRATSRGRRIMASLNERLRRLEAKVRPSYEVSADRTGGTARERQRAMTTWNF